MAGIETWMSPLSTLLFSETVGTLRLKIFQALYFKKVRARLRIPFVLNPVRVYEIQSMESNRAL